MLDLNHPKAKFVFAIADQEGRLLSLAKRMTLVNTDEKQKLLVVASQHIAQLRKLLADGWGSSRKKTAAIDNLHKAFSAFAAVPSSNDFAIKWQGQQCTVCRSMIENLVGYPDMIYCRKCISVFDSSRQDVNQAFGLWCI